MVARIEKVVMLQSADLFAHCNGEQVLRLSSIAAERSVEADDTVYEPGQPADALYCVVRGAVRIGQRGDGSRRVGPLGTFGAEELLSGTLRTSSAVAAEETLLLVIGADDFFDLLADNVEIVKALFRRYLGPGRAGSRRALR